MTTPVTRRRAATGAAHGIVYRTVSDVRSEAARGHHHPSLRYRDALAATDWLCRAFGFEKDVVYAGDDGMVHHAQLTFGNSVVMPGSVDNANE